VPQQSRKAAGKSLKPPVTLTDYGRAEWLLLAPGAHQAGTLTTTTARSFELLVETLATERKARELVAAEGITVQTDRGGVKPHPACRTMEAARLQAAALLKLFRLEPASPRSSEGSQPPTATGKKNPWHGVLRN
jgi:P27 family predicted phage terminase small subunit